MYQNLRSAIQTGALIFANRRLIFLFTTILVFSISVVAGQENKTQLRDYLNKVESKHNVRFSFIDEEINGIDIIAPDLNLTLSKILSELGQQSRLVFSIVSDGFVVVHRVGNPLKTICGYLKDHESGEPVSNATVTGLRGERVYTDEKGFFTINLTDNPKLYITHLTYKSKSINAVITRASDCLIIMMDKEIKNLDGVVVRHFLTRGLRVKADRSYSLLPKQAGLLPGLTEPDVLQTLQQLPGIVSIDQSVSNISVRSGSHDQNVFLWNGIRLFQVGHFFGLISAFNPNLPHSVTVYKNGTPAQFGESVSGTILIDSPPDTIGTREKSSVGLNLVNADFNTAFRTSSKTYWQISGRRSITDIFRSPVYDKYHERVFQNTKITNFFADQVVDYTSEEEFRFYDLTAQVKHEINAGSSISSNIILVGKDLNVTQRMHPDSLPETSQLKEMTFGGNIVYKRAWSSRQKTSIAASLSHYKLSSEDNQIDGDLITKQENRVNDAGLQITHSAVLLDGYNLTANYNLSNISIANEDRQLNGGSQSSADDNVVSQWLAVQLDKRIDRFYFLAGIRNQHFLSFPKLRIEPRLNLSYYPSEKFTLTLSGETKSQTSYQQIDRQEDFFGIESKRWRLADERSVPLLTSKQASFQLQFQHRGWLLMGEVFAKRVNGITSQSQGFRNQFVYMSAIGDYTVNGAEFLAQKKYRSITAWVNFQLNNSNYHFSSLQPARFTNNYEIPHLLRFGLIYADERWGAAVGGSWSAGRYYTQPLSRIPSVGNDGKLSIMYEMPNQSQLEDNFQVNASFSRVLRFSETWSIRTGVAVQNLFDYSAVINRIYRINSGSE
ncbi:MAG: hypothetical protein ABW036_11640, partial [Flavitalea sp.]